MVRSGRIWLLVVSGLSLAPRVAALQAEPAAEPVGARPLLVLAAASLTDVLPQVAADWGADAGAEVQFSFAATSRLAPQLVQGAPADVFVSADRTWMDWAESIGGVDPASRRSFASNLLVVVVPSDAEGPADATVLTDPRARIALADPNVPAGRYARQALANAGLWSEVEPRVIRGGSVRATLEWVGRGEVDAGVVYRTDAIAEPRVRVAHEFDQSSHEPIEYVAAVAAASSSPEAAARFIAYLSTPAARAVFEDAGFGAPPVRSTDAPQGLVPALPDPASAIRLSVLVALAATIAGLLPAIGLGWLLARHEFPGKSILATLVLAPLVLPPVVTGFILLTLLGSRSVIGGWLATLGLRVPFTILGASLAALIVGLPLYVMAIRGAFEAVDARYEEVSWTLGVHRWTTFRRVTLPLASPGILAGAILAFARALGEFGATIVLAGNIEGTTQTIALAVYSLLESPSGQAATWTLVGASVAISLAALLGYEALSRRQRARLENFRG